MAYNKSKFVETAQKLLNQGKVAQAIAEYQQILKFEPRDQVTLMTVGELYIRQGETFQAIDYFERLAQIFVGDGFLTKAIAVYKRIAKLAPEEIRPLEKLADLYVQQGVMSEARPLFLQLAEIHLKNNRQSDAVNLLKKLLLAEPDNLRIQVRLADLYQAMGSAKDAMEMYVSAAQRALARGDQAECEKLADKALKTDPNNLAATIVKARSFSARGNVAQAAELLEHVPNLEKGGEQAELLLDLHIKASNWDKATALALSIFEADEKNFSLTQKITESLIGSGQGEKAMAIIERTRIPMLDAGEHEAVSRILNELVVAMPGRVEPHEWLVDSYGRTSDSFRLPDALAQLGDTLVENGEFERAKAVYEQLVDREPESDSAKRKLNDVLQKLGGAPAHEVEAPVDLTAELEPPPAPKVRPDIEPAAPVAISSQLDTEARDKSLSVDDETQKFIAQSLTDVDLFASYGLTQKAIGLLEAVLRRAPRHTPTLEKLLDFVLGAGDDRRTAELAARLEKIYGDHGDARNTERFAELRRRFQRAAGLSDADLATASEGALGERAHVSVPVEEAESDEIPTFEIAPEPVSVEDSAAESPVMEPVTASQPAASSQEFHEVDLSDEWLSTLKEVEPEQAAEPSAEPPQEEPALEFVSTQEPEPTLIPPADTPAYAEFQVAPPEPPAQVPGTSLEAAEVPVETGEPEFVSAEHGAPAAPAQPPIEELPSFEEVVASSAAPSLPELEISEPEPVKIEASVAPPTIEEIPETPAKKEEPAFELDQDFDLVLEPESEPATSSRDEAPAEPLAGESHAEPEPVLQNAASTAEQDFASDRFLADLASEIETLGMGQLTPSYSTSAEPEAPARRGNSPSPLNITDSGPLKDVFDDFRAELGEMGAEEEDLETHYNLGTAFREMGLLDEAISEFQKVAKANEQGRPFRYAMQCCTLLGLAFMEKGQPGIAAMWYERALQTPGIEPESILALRYDLGIAQESAGEPEAALKSFSKVYAMNIDYRDVAERISALQKPSR